MTETAQVRRKENPDAPRGELLQLRVDRRLGHEWDDWDGNPLPDNGTFTASPSLFFGAAVLASLATGGALAIVLWLVSPRLALVWPPLPALLGAAIAVGVVLTMVWIGLLALSMQTRRALLPGRLAERGPLAAVLPVLERMAGWVGISRDRLGNSALRVYNAIAAARHRPGVDPDDILVLLPRCLSKDAMRGAMEVSGRYGVPLFVAARGMYARKMIRERRPKRIVAVACERDLMSGVHDVAAKLPVLGTTLTLPDGPCKNTEVDLSGLEEHIRSFLGLEGVPEMSGAPR